MPQYNSQRELCHISFIIKKDQERLDSFYPEKYLKVYFSNKSQERIPSDIFQTNFMDWYLQNFPWNCPHANATGRHRWYINIDSGNGLVPSGNKPLTEPRFMTLYGGTRLQQAVPINRDNIPQLLSLPALSRNIKQIFLFCSYCGYYTGWKTSRKKMF